MTLSGPYPLSVSSATAFPGNYSWPMSLFMLDRCFLVNRYTLANPEGAGGDQYPQFCL
jgi:hypothetical protein